MKRRVLASLATLLAVGFAAWQPVAGGTGGASVTVLEQSAVRTVFEVTVPGVEVTPVVAENEEFAQVALPGEVMAVLEEGKPEVPKVSVLLAIPRGARVSARVVDKETRRLAVGNVYPLQPPLIDHEPETGLVIDRQFYSRDASYPAVDLAVMNTGVWRDLDVANIQVYPVHVNPARGEVEVMSRVRVEVSYSGGSYPRTVADWMVPQYAQYIDNFGQLGVGPLDEYSPGVRYLVVCHNNYSANSFLVDSLMGWVKKRGYETRMIAKSSFTKQEIKDSIRAEYNRNTPKTLRWVLLVGEYAEIPQGSYSGVGRSDFWYSDLEPWPSGDNYPEIGIARFSPSSATDLENQIKKVLKYQKNPPSTNNWLDKLSMPAHKEQYPGKYSGCTRGIYNMPKPYWNPAVVETIMGQFTGNATVTAAVNQGRNIVAYRGHGDYTIWAGWGADGNWTNSHVDALTNGDLTPVVYHIACNCGDIYQAECHSEKWMRKYPGGGVASLGATQASYTYPNHGICSSLVRATSDTWTIAVPGVRNYGPTVYNLADVKAYGVDAYVAKYWPASPYPYNIWMYVMLGDPSMPVWCGGMPQAASVAKPDSIPLGPYNLNVTVTVGGQPVEGALVCAWKDPDFYVSERTDASGQATLAVNAGAPGEVMLTISEGHARHSSPGVPHTPILPYEGTIPAGGGGVQRPNLAYVSNEVQDPPPGGNNNGRFDPGETGNILVTVRNTGNAQADNVTAVLRSGHAQFTITDPNAAYGNVPQGEQRTNTADPFTATASSAIPGGTTVPCTLKLHSDNWGDWTYTFTLQVGVPPTPGMLLVDHDTGYCKLTVSCQGSIGYDLPPADAGAGFCYPKTAASALFYGSFAVGNGDAYVADRHFSRPASGTPNTDLVPVDSLRPVVPPVAGDEHFRGSFSDAGHPSAVGLKVTQNSHQVAASGYDDFVVLVYDIQNNGASAVNGLYAGIFADFDIGSTPTANICTSDVARRFTFMRQASSANPTVGVKILAPTTAANLAAVDHARYVYPDSAMTDGMKWRFLNGTIVQQNSNRNYDWSVLTSVGPFDLAVGARQRVAFAFCGGTSNAQAREHADSAQAWYNMNVGVSEERVPVVANAARPLFLSPNPFNRGTFVNYFSLSAGPVELSAYDATGRQVEQVVFSTDKGSGRYFWQPRELAPGIYFLKVRTPDRESVAKVLLTD